MVGVRVVVALDVAVAGLVVLCEVVVGGTVVVVVKPPVVTVGPVVVGPDALLVVVTGTVVVVGGTVVTVVVVGRTVVGGIVVGEAVVLVVLVVVIGAAVVPELQIPLVTPTRFPVARLICVIPAPTPAGALAPQVHPVVYLVLHVPASIAKQLEYVIVAYVFENGFPPRPFEEAPHKMRSPSNVLPAGPDPSALKNMQLSIGVIKKDDVRTATLLTPP